MYTHSSEDELVHPNRLSRNMHPMALRTFHAVTDIYKFSVIPRIVIGWNELPTSLLSSTEDADDCFARFASLIRQRD